MNDLTICVLAFVIFVIALLWQEKELRRNGR